jgi:hypothetical protein
MSLRRGGALAALLATALACQPAAARSARAGEAFQFGVIGHSFKAGPDDSELRQAIRDTNQANLAFVVATGIKADSESCSDKLYARRMALLDESAWPLVVSLAASDWSGCKNSAGRSNAIERLNRLRELFFADDHSLGARKLTLARLSASAKFRSYAENSQWESGRVLFATINLPANNNHFLPEAGRNSEFEDRLVANRSWLQRLFAAAQRKKLEGIVLFSDGDVGVQNADERSLLPSFSTKQDGFAGMRRQIRTLAKKFSGKVLLVDTKRRKNPPAPAIEWNDNLGHIGVNASWVQIQVNPGRPNLFDIKNGEAQ